MSLAPGQVFYAEFSTYNPTTGASQNADSTPTVVLRHNNATDSSVSITLTNPQTGLYAATGTIPSTYAAGDAVGLLATATVASITATAVVKSWSINPTTAYGSRVVTQDYPTAGSGNYTIETNTGAPIQGAIVTAYPAASYASNPLTAVFSGQTTSDINGNWTMYLLPGSYTCTISAPNYSFPSFSLTVV